MMPSLKSPLVAALSYSLFTLSPTVSALQLQTPRARSQNPITSIALHQHTTHCGKNNNGEHRHRLILSSHRQGGEDDPSESNSRKRKKTDDGDDDNEDDNEEYLNMDDFIDFENMAKKSLYDIPEYGSIRSLESPYDNYNPIDPLSADEIELWIKKNNLQNKKQQQQKRWRNLFPWVSPLTSLLLPKRRLPSSDKSARSRPGYKTGRRHSNFDDGLSAPKLLRNFMSKPNSARNFLVTISTVAFIYQIITAVWYLPGFNRILAASVAGDAYSAAALDGGLSNIPQWTPMEVVLRALGLVGGGASVVIASGSSMRGAMGRVIGRGPIAAHSMGPFFLDCAHQPYPLSYFQKHRFLSSGFLHGSLLHLGMNLRALLSLPSWLENGIGKGVYLSAYLVAIVTGNIAHSLSTVGGRAASSLCIGASGGICGLYGLMMASLLKMGNADAAYYVMKQMVWLIAFGYLVPNVSNAGHVGGFVGGWLIGYLFGPGYERSYTLNRADGGSNDKADVQFRQMMGSGIYPSSEQAIFPLKYLWMGIGVAVLAKPDLRMVPIALLKSVFEPGSMSGARALLR